MSIFYISDGMIISFWFCFTRDTSIPCVNVVFTCIYGVFSYPKYAPILVEVSKFNNDQNRVVLNLKYLDLYYRGKEVLGILWIH